MQNNHLAACLTVYLHRSQVRVTLVKSVSESAHAMAKLIQTGEFEAVDLKRLHSADLLYLDDEIDATLTGRHSNGGFAEICLELRRGVIELIKFVKTSKRDQRK